MNIIKSSVIALIVFQSAAHAENFTLFNTGVGNDSLPLTPGAPDSHWTVVDGPGITASAPAVVLSDPPSVYVLSTDSRWIGIAADGSADVNTPYVFEMTFDLTGFDSATAEISGLWGVDNTGLFRLNGIPMATGPAGLESFAGFNINTGFLPGINTFQFLMTNSEGPAAINISSISGTASPIPESTASAMILMAAGCILFRRKRA